MRYGIRTLVILCILLAINVVAARNISDVSFDEDILIDLSGNQTSMAFNLSLGEDATVNMNVRYLGPEFPLSLEFFNDSDQTVADEATDAPDDLSLDLVAGHYMVLVSAQPNNAGRAILRFSLGDGDLPPIEDGDPLSGEWLATYVDDYTTNCPDVMSLNDVELPLDGSTHNLMFSVPLQPLDFHRAVAPEEIAEVPDFFLTDILPDGTFEVAPGIQTLPYVYRYTVNNSQNITLEYIETISLSDCEANMTIELTYTGDDTGFATPDADDTDAPVSMTVEGWSILGDATEAGDGSSLICGAPTAPDASWFFDAPESFVNQVANGYGETLAFDLLRRDAVQIPVIMSVTLVVGNAILLSYELPQPVTDVNTRFEIPLTETTGWVDIDGMFDASDPEMFQQLLSDVTRVQISGNVPDSDGFCLQNPAVGDVGATPAGTIAFYVISPTDDGGGIPVGCEGYMLPQDTSQPFTDDAETNIRESLEPLLAMPTNEVPGTNYTNYLGGQGLSVGQIDIRDGHATVVIEGAFLLMGTCADPQIEAQFLLSIFADPRIESATVITNGENLKVIADMSGQTPDNAVYTRDDIRERD